MAGKPKQGIEYSGWSVNIFDGDSKIDKLIDAQGWVGFAIYFYLCQMAYKFDGYFYSWDYDCAASTARRMGGGIGSHTVRETVAYCLQIALFDQRTFDRWHVLTSRGIQRRYVAATAQRRSVTVNQDYWLLKASESGSLIKVAVFDDLPPANDDSQGANDDLQGANADKSKAKESKVKDSIYISAEQQAAPPTIRLPLTGKGEYCIYQEQIDRWNEAYPAVDVLQQLRAMAAWLDANPQRRKTSKGIGKFIVNWLSREQDKGHTATKRPTGPDKGKGQFNDPYYQNTFRELIKG